MSFTEEQLDFAVRLADVAAGRRKADVVLKNAAYLDVFSVCVRRGDIAVCGKSEAKRS